MAHLNLIARIDRQTKDVVLICNGREFGKLSNCEVCHVYEGFAEDSLGDVIEGDMSLSEMLAAVRSGLEGMVGPIKGSFTAEQYSAEGMRLRAAGEALNLPHLTEQGQIMVSQGSAMQARGLSYHGF